MGFLDELNRRKVIRVALAYAAVSWLALQVADVVLPAYDAPAWVFRVIVTTLLAGAPITLVLAWFFRITPDGVRRDDDAPTAADTAAGPSSRRFDIIIIGILAAAVIVLVVDSYLLPERRFGGRTDAPSIAVLPFVNMSPDAEQDYFSDGITEEILNALAQVSSLRVTGRTSSFAFKGRNEDLRLIGRTLGVGYVLEGSVRRSGNTLRITAQLIDVADGFHLWSESYDRELTDVFAIQDQIANAILRELKAELLTDEASVVTALRTNGEAYSNYLLARQRIYARTRPMLESAVELLDSAIAIDPQYAPLYAQRGIAELLLAEGNYGAIPLERALDNARRWLDRSIALDGQLAEGWAGLGLYYLSRQDQAQQAIGALRRALSINPNLLDASNWLKNALNRSGQIEESRAIAVAMVDRDPLYGPGLVGAVSAWNRFGEYDSALALIKRVSAFTPDRPVVLAMEGMTLLYRGEVVAALPLLERAAQLEPDNASTREQLGLALLATHQFDRLAGEGGGELRVLALRELGRSAEATALALALADDGIMLPLLAHFNRTGRSDLVVDYIDRHWANLDAFEAAYPYDVNGHQEMMEAALAYRLTDDNDAFDDASARISVALERLAASGLNHWIFLRSRALGLALAGERDAALDMLADAIAAGYRDALPLRRSQPALRAVADDPLLVQFEQRMAGRIARDRAALGLP
jgi:TolB-like protein